VWNEALRLGLMPSLDTIKTNDKDAAKVIEKKIQVSQQFFESLHLSIKDLIDRIQREVVASEN
jgi:hypothetical protein